MSQDAIPSPGTLLADKYRVERVLGQGGMGVVLSARHELLSTSVAIKVLSARAIDLDSAVPRFLREARAAAALKSEYVGRVTDFGTLADLRPFMVMELLDGNDLSELQKSGGLSRQEWIDAFLQACAGLAEAHVAGIVHRDLKLANLFRSRRPDGSFCTKILDFGISKLVKTDELLGATTKTDAMLGTPYYMSPEHVRSSRDVDARSDIWQMGVVLYQAMTGSLPFVGDNVGMLFARIIELAPQPPRDLTPDLPEEIERVILACLDKDPAGRPSTIAQVALRLEPFAGPEGRLAAQRACAMQPVQLLPASVMPSPVGTSPAMPLSTQPIGAAGLSVGPDAAGREWTEAPVSRSVLGVGSSLSLSAIVAATLLVLGGGLFYALYALWYVPAASEVANATRASSESTSSAVPTGASASATPRATVGESASAASFSPVPAASASADPASKIAPPPSSRVHTPAPPPVVAKPQPPPERPTLH